MEDAEILLPFTFSSNFRLVIPEEKSKTSQQTRGQGGHLGFLIGPKNTNLLKNVNNMIPFNIRSAGPVEKS